MRNGRGSGGTSRGLGLALSFRFFCELHQSADDAMLPINVERFSSQPVVNLTLSGLSCGEGRGSSIKFKYLLYSIFSSSCSCACARQFVMQIAVAACQKQKPRTAFNVKYTNLLH